MDLLVVFLFGLISGATLALWVVYLLGKCADSVNDKLAERVYAEAVCDLFDETGDIS